MNTEYIEELAKNLKKLLKLEESETYFQGLIFFASFCWWMYEICFFICLR